MYLAHKSKAILNTCSLISDAEDILACAAVWRLHAGQILVSLSTHLLPFLEGAFLEKQEKDSILSVVKVFTPHPCVLPFLI